MTLCRRGCSRRMYEWCQMLDADQIEGFRAAFADARPACPPQAAGLALAARRAAAAGSQPSANPPVAAPKSP
ncbi:hypothetical protein [Paragemmobacter straminiformis]|uniref:hypothetical protein n=1 Tax=Paragemmobacter straminiformis TaxID=2045119 RepID=UPI00163A0694|nr:hypothetical protein [Gemmobacter straminiformis]